MYIVNDPALTPLVKWAGGKAKMVPQLLKHMPPTFNTFHSIFAGGAALYLSVNRPGFISDINPDLINFYRVVAREPDSLLDFLFEIEEEYNSSDNKKRVYYKVRARHSEALVSNALYINPIGCAADFLFLNKCGFNGLYRVNRKGEFNSPWGHKEKINLVSDMDNFMGVSELLLRTGVHQVNYRRALRHVSPGDFIYADPPYYSGGSGFVGYATGGNFNDETEQKKLEFNLRDMADKGVLVMTTNSDTPFIRELYQDWYIHPVEMPRRISAATEGRGKHTELIITSYNLDEDEAERDRKIWYGDGDDDTFPGLDKLITESYIDASYEPEAQEV
jgi:DNA adenine methylase